MISITIPKLPKFQAALKKYPEFAAKEIIVALTKSLTQIEAETKPITPLKDGRLKSSIGRGAGGIFKVQKMTGTIGTNVEYALKQHEGFYKHRHGQRKFLEVGTQKAKKNITGFFKDAYNNVFNKIANQSK